VPWLNQRSIVADNNSKSFGGMRIVWANLDIGNYPWKCGIRKSNQELILELLELKRARQLVPDGGIICLPTKSRHNSKKQSFALSTTAHCVLVWTHNLVTNRTEAIWWGDDESVPSSSLKSVLGYQRKLVSHPMFMALVAAIVIYQATQDAVESIRDTINQVENRTKHSPFNPSLRSTAAGSYASLSAVISGSATHLAGKEMESSTLREILDSIMSYQWPEGIERPEWAEKVIEEVNDCVKILRQRLKAQELKLRYLSHRTNIQLTAVGPPSIFLTSILG